MKERETRAHIDEIVQSALIIALQDLRITNHLERSKRKMVNANRFSMHFYIRIYLRRRKQAHNAACCQGYTIVK